MNLDQNLSFNSGPEFRKVACARKYKEVMKVVR